MDPKISRRRFLKTGCITAAAVGVTVCGGGAALAAADQPKIILPSYTYGDQSMDNNNRILLAYDSKAGSTAEVAARIGEILSKHALAVDVLPVAKVTGLTPYRSVIVGSAIRAGKVLPDITAFVQKNQSALQQKSLSLFVVCLTLKDDTAENRKIVAAYLDPLRALVKPAAEGLFAGVMNLQKLGFVERLMMKMMKSPEGDFRKWDQIEAWAESLAAAA